MPDTLEKLRPDRDLQCYFQEPSAVAALSGASPAGFSVSGTWRQQFDWAVIEWNRDNVFEHLTFRNLPDGDLRGLVLTYEEVRNNCIPIDSSLYATVASPSLRVWTDASGADPYLVPLLPLATPIEGSYTAASCTFVLSGSITQNDWVGLALGAQHFTHQVYYDDTIETIVEAIGLAINAESTVLQATWTGSTIQLQARDSIKGANGNCIGVYSYVSGAGTESWDKAWQTLSGGTSPTKWRVTIDFSSLGIPVDNVRKMRWTYAADLQPGAFVRSEFSVTVANWTLTGTNSAYQVAGPGSRRIEDSSADVMYSQNWGSGEGNYSGGTIHFTSTQGETLQYNFQTAQVHSLYLGGRLADNGATIAVSVDGGAAVPFNLARPLEDVLVRLPLGQLAVGNHTLSVTHTGPQGTYFYFDFIELAVPTTTLPTNDPNPQMTLATDWDTDHSLALAPERTARMIQALGFSGRANHYAGAMWFYEMVCDGQQYATTAVDFAGTPQLNSIVTVQVIDAVVQHVVHPGDTSETIAIAFALLLNQGYTSVWAQAQGARLIIQARAMGSTGNEVTISANPTSGDFTATVTTLAVGTDGEWHTDLAATPRVNRAARDWTRAYAGALTGYGIDVTVAFSTELRFGNPDPAVGIAQRYPSGEAVIVSTPALQTNFSPASLAYWQQVYVDMAQVMSDAGARPYLQFGEVQWWYKPDDGSGMPFYDSYTEAQFQAAYGKGLQTIPNQNVDPAAYPNEAAFLPTLIGAFTSAIIAFVRSSHANCRFEVLYPTDVNDTLFNEAINFPSASWTAAILDCLKTESFTYTYSHNLDESRTTILFGQRVGFPWAQRSHLVGISDPQSAWVKEEQMALGAGAESVVLFALDQFCLIGYPVELRAGPNRSTFAGA